MNRTEKLNQLAENPKLLEDLLNDIPEEILKSRRIKGKWSIHEHVCHLAEAQSMMIERFRTFKTVKNPAFQPYLPGTSTTPDDYLMLMDFQESLVKIKNDRIEMISFLETFSEEDWQNQGSHPEYKAFSADIFLRHIIMHDHLHMYRIEELWLTEDEYLKN